MPRVTFQIREVDGGDVIDVCRKQRNYGECNLLTTENKPLTLEGSDSGRSPTEQEIMPSFGCFGRWLVSHYEIDVCGVAVVCTISQSSTRTKFWGDTHH
ncbi:hypothetical protein L596_002534 [Steinernema carpocapsae]|uniref:Uncharacterized protein n=1 Tax=Steinernema carpocapsae TaxID=34508 RepID=A0A4U8UTH0_STECR|nr:hypothetical protein L596_002534 [Steinernema carpocapsae]